MENISTCNSFLPLLSSNDCSDPELALVLAAEVLCLLQDHLHHLYTPAPAHSPPPRPAEPTPSFQQLLLMTLRVLRVLPAEVLKPSHPTSQLATPQAHHQPSPAAQHLSATPHMCHQPSPATQHLSSPWQQEQQQPWRSTHDCFLELHRLVRALASTFSTLVMAVGDSHRLTLAECRWGELG
jgi:hypothetical protein